MIRRALLLCLLVATLRGAEAPPAPQSDGWLALEIRGMLMVRANVSATGTKVNVKQGVVTLSGFAETEQQRQITESVVREVEGVRTVENRMIVKPVAVAATGGSEGLGAGGAEGQKPARRLSEVIDDASITAAVKKKLLSSYPASTGKIAVLTQNGLVTLTGTAGAEAEKELLSELAKGVKGVNAVENKVVVDNPGQRSTPLR